MAGHPSSRIEWVDTARGMTIILVVLFHAMRMVGEDAVAQPLVHLNYLVGAVRLPAFFLMSGLLTSFGLSRDWRAYAERRLWPSVWVFVIWGTLLIGLSHVLPWPDRVLPPSHLWQMWTHPFVHMWFLRDLIVLAVIARLTMRAPAPLVLGLAAAWYLHSHYIQNMPVELGVYFLLGARLPDLVLKAPQGYRALRLGLSVAACLAFAALLGIEEAKPLIAAAGIVGLLCAAALAGSVPPLNRALHYAGRSSLAIYLMHMIVMGAAATLPLAGLPGAEWWHPVALTAAGVAGSILCFRLLMAGGLGWLFAPPPLPALPRMPAAG